MHQLIEQYRHFIMKSCENSSVIYYTKHSPVLWTYTNYYGKKWDEHSIGSVCSSLVIWTQCTRNLTYSRVATVNYLNEFKILSNTRYSLCNHSCSYIISKRLWSIQNRYRFDSIDLKFFWTRLQNVNDFKEYSNI